MSHSLIATALALALAWPLAAQPVQGTFSFRGDQVGQPTPLTLVVPPGVEATFRTVNGAPGDFRVAPDHLVGNPFDVLLRSADGSSSDLFVAFSEPLTRVRIHLGLEAAVDAPENRVTVRRFIRTAEIGQTTVAGTLAPDGRVPEATIELGGDGRVFDGLSLASPARDMALAYVRFSIGDPVSTVPEPATPWLVAAGGVALAVAARRRRRA